MNHKLSIINPIWLFSRLLEKCGIVTYLERVEFAAHLFAGCTFAAVGVIWGPWIPAVWVVWTIWDELVNDGNWKCFSGHKPCRDLLIDLFSKLLAPFVYTIWRLI